MTAGLSFGDLGGYIAMQAVPFPLFSENLFYPSNIPTLAFKTAPRRSTHSFELLIH